MKALLLDVGNTRLKWGVADDDGIHRTGTIGLDKIREEGLGVLSKRLPNHIDTAMASNVAGATMATRLAGVVGAHCGCDLHFAKTAREGYGIRNGYRQPRRMGVDRWVAMIGAWAELEDACLIVDAGTAVTIDVLDHEGQHLGGQILPGVALMTESLAKNTSDIARFKPQKASKHVDMDMFATDTRAAVSSGALNAVTGAVERAITILDSNGYDPYVVLTGGDATRILTALGEEALHRPNLVLQGLLRMLESRQ